MAIARLPAHVLVEHIRNHQSRMALDVLSRFGFDAEGVMIKNLARYGGWETNWAPTMAAAWDRSNRNQQHAIDALNALMARRGNWETMAPMAEWLLERIEPIILEKRSPVHHACFHGQIEAVPALLKRLNGTEDPKAYNWTKTLNGHPDTPLSLALESGDIDTITAVRTWGGPVTEHIRVDIPPPARTLSVDAYAGQRSKKPEETTRVWMISQDRAALLSCMEIENWSDLFHRMGIDNQEAPHQAIPGSSDTRPAMRRM